MPLAILALAAAGCARGMEPAVPRPVPGVVPVPALEAPVPTTMARPDSGSQRSFPAVLEVAEGEATYYADRFEGRRTASGVVFDNRSPYAAHRSWPFGTVVRVTNLANDRSVILQVVDRGPFGSTERARRTIIDVSRSAAEALDFVRAGRTPVQVEVLEWGAGRGG